MLQTMFKWLLVLQTMFKWCTTISLRGGGGSFVMYINIKQMQCRTV